MIQNKFRHLCLEINKAEFEILMKLENQFLEEELKLDHLIRSLPGDEVKTKLKDFDNIMLNPKITKLIEEDFSDFERKLDEGLTLIKIKQTKDLSELFAIFQNNLPNEDLLKSLQVTEPLGQELLRFNAEHIFEDQKRRDVFILSPKLSYYHESGTNSLKIGDSKRDSNVFKKSDIEKITSVSYNIKFKDKMIDSSIVSALNLLSQNLINVESLSLDLECHEDSHHEIAFYGLISSIFARPEKLKKIQIYAASVVLGDLGPLYLFENVFPKIKDLQSFDCTLYETQATSNVLRAITKIDFTNNLNLEKFRLNLAGASLEEQDIIQSLDKVPNVKDLLLGVGNTVLTDQAFEAFATKTLPSLDLVERLEVGFWETRMTNSDVSKFLTNLPNVVSLFVGFRSSPISDVPFQDFLEKKLPTLSNLQELKFNLEGTDVSQNLANKLKVWKK